MAAPGGRGGLTFPEQGRACWYLYRQEGEYALSLTSSGPTAQTPPAILACFQGANSLVIVPTNQYLPPIGADGYFTATFPPSLLGNRTPEELLDKVDYYLQHEREREAIARNGHKKVMQYYTYTKKIKKLLAWAGGEGIRE